MFRTSLPTRLLAGSLLLALPAAGQRSPSAAAAAGPIPAQAPPPPPPPPPALDDPTAPLLPEPDPATRQLYARQRVRAVLKVRLDDEGAVRDTVEYQEIDAYGRRTLLCRTGGGWQERRQWSYDDAGHCTSMVIHPVPGRSFTTIYSYNPALGRGRCEVLQPSGRRTTVCELQRRALGDTLLTEARFWFLTVGRYHFPQTGFRRTWRFALSADTVLTLVSSYTPKGRHRSTQLQYELRRDGQTQETGAVDVVRALRAARQRAGQVPFGQLPALLHRSPASFRPTALFRYDARQRLAEHQLITTWDFVPTPAYTTLVSTNVRQPLTASPGARSAAFGQASIRTVTTNTYNNQDQLIGQQRRLLGTRYLWEPRYLVLSYQPDGLPAGETTRSSADKPAFYRYQYQYYE
ncbi:hypothetical protein [Hymenobacter edaphi]|uniref:RHS repeat protein n=1 Tax=Hymenobacter edaphi TaxID=2211146 RepID=A0A328BHA0_9BACT|nr:hypothetical protein [Hymenobacter edaphi]RAK66852.1 hypothetical protein DLM85_11625 [Hymenobacter edaphi]